MFDPAHRLQLADKLIGLSECTDNPDEQATLVDAADAIRFLIGHIDTLHTIHQVDRQQAYERRKETKR